jgi:NADPH:quinone reductase-like Zn-dependent oxidoreductase
VLVHGGAGAVSIFAVQLGRSRSCRGWVSNTSSTTRAARFEECVRDMDVVFDTVGGDL